MWSRKNAAMAQVVEHVLGKDEVTSSNLVSSSKNLGCAYNRDFYFFTCKFILPMLQLFTQFSGP